MAQEVALLNNMLQRKNLEITELLNQDQKKTAELNENRERIKRLEMINNIGNPWDKLLQYIIQK